MKSYFARAIKRKKPSQKVSRTIFGISDFSKGFILLLMMMSILFSRGKEKKTYENLKEKKKIIVLTQKKPPENNMKVIYEIIKRNADSSLISWTSELL